MDLVHGRFSLTEVTEGKLEALKIFNFYNLSDKFGWTPEQIKSLSVSEYDDYIEIINIVNQKRKNEIDENNT